MQANTSGSQPSGYQARARGHGMANVDVFSAPSPVAFTTPIPSARDDGPFRPDTVRARSRAGVWSKLHLTSKLQLKSPHGSRQLTVTPLFGSLLIRLQFQGAAEMVQSCVPADAQAMFGQTWKPIKKEPGSQQFVRMLRGLETAPEFASMREGALGKLVLDVCHDSVLRTAVFSSPHLLPVSLGGAKGVPCLGLAQASFKELLKIQARFAAQ
jgi:hypothetical protein